MTDRTSLPRTPSRNLEQSLARTNFRFRGLLAKAAEGVRAPVNRRAAAKQIDELRQRYS